MLLHGLPVTRKSHCNRIAVFGVDVGVLDGPGVFERFADRFRPGVRGRGSRRPLRGAVDAAEPFAPRAAPRGDPVRTGSPRATRHAPMAAGDNAAAGAVAAGSSSIMKMTTAVVATSFAFVSPTRTMFQLCQRPCWRMELCTLGTRVLEYP